MAPRSDRILLTGSGGFTGRPLANRLRQDGHTVVGLTLHPGEVGEISGDLSDADWTGKVVADVKPEVVLHLAGISVTQHADVADIYRSNVLCTVSLLNALTALRSPPRLVVVASSAAVYAVPGDGMPISEECALDPKTHYAVSKRAVEDAARIFSDRLPIVVVRPFNYTGPGQGTEFVVPKIVDHFARRAARIELGNLDLYRDISDVDRVVDIYARMVSSAVPATTVNICSGRAVLLRSIVSLMEDICSHRIEVVQNPALVRTDEPHTILGSAARLEGLLGELPNPDFSTTLRRMYEFRRAEVAR